MSILYPGRTGNGWAVHLTVHPGGTKVPALCGASVFSDAIPAPTHTPAAIEHLCKRCSDRLRR